MKEEQVQSNQFIPKVQNREFATAVHRSRVIRLLLNIIGTISLILGVIGIVTPILPTTPFLLLTAACYAKGSVRFYHWLMNHRLLGPYLYKWRVEKKIPLKVKIYATSMIALTMGSTILFFMPPILAAKIVAGLIGIAVIVYINHFPSG